MRRALELFPTERFPIPVRFKASSQDVIELGNGQREKKPTDRKLDIVSRSRTDEH